MFNYCAANNLTTSKADKSLFHYLSSFLRLQRDTQAITELERLKESNKFVHLFLDQSKHNYNLRNRKNNLMTSKTETKTHLYQDL